MIPGRRRANADDAIQVAAFLNGAEAGSALGNGDVQAKREQLPILVILSGLFIRVL